jgi:hypothetical protein
MTRRSFFGGLLAACLLGPKALYGLVRQKPIPKADRGYVYGCDLANTGTDSQAAWTILQRNPNGQFEVVSQGTGEMSPRWPNASYGAS